MYNKIFNEDSSTKGAELGVDIDEDWIKVLNTNEGVRVVANIILTLGYGEPAWRPDINIYRSTALKDMAEHLLQHVENLDSNHADAVLRQIRLYKGA